MHKPRLLLAEDHYMVGQGLRRLLEEEYQVDGPYGDGGIIADLVRDSPPDVLLLDLMLKKRHGMEIIPDVVRDSPKTRIVVVTMNADPGTMEAAISLGAVGFLPKDTGVEELLEALRTAGPESVYRSPRITHPPEPLSLGPLDLAISELTPRRRDVFEMIGDGYSSEEMARRCSCTPGAIYHIRSELRRVLGFETDEALARAAILWRAQLPVGSDRVENKERKGRSRRQ